MILYRNKYFTKLCQLAKYNCSKHVTTKKRELKHDATTFDTALHGAKKSAIVARKSKKEPAKNPSSVNVSPDGPGDRIGSGDEKLKLSDATARSGHGPEGETKIVHEGGRKLVDGNAKMTAFIVRNMMAFPLQPSEDSMDSDKGNDEHAFSESPIPSVSAILSDTVSKENAMVLEQWKRKNIAEHGEEMFQAMQAANLARGKKFHSVLRNFLLGKCLIDVEVEEDIKGCWKSVKSILTSISDVKMVEGTICHPVLKYKGIVDCVASYRNVPCVIEWKQSEKIKSDLSKTYDAPVQLCAYMGALSWCKSMEPSARVNNGLIVVAYTDGTPASVFPMDANMSLWYWKEWLRRLQHFWMIRTGIYNN